MAGVRQMSETKVKEWKKADTFALSALIIAFIAIGISLVSWLAPDPLNVLPPAIHTGYTDIGVRVSFTAPPEGVVYFTVDGTPPTLDSFTGAHEINTTEQVIIRAATEYKGRWSMDVTETVNLQQLNPPTSNRTLYTDITTSAEITLIFDPNAVTVHYTLDGSEPTLLSPRFTSPIFIEENTLIQARAFRPGHVPSEIIKFNYAIREELPALSETYQPILAINAPTEPQITRPPLAVNPEPSSELEIEVSYRDENYANIGGLLWPRRWPTIRIIVSANIDVEKITLQSNHSPNVVVPMASINPRFWEREIEFTVTDIMHEITVTVYATDGQAVTYLLNVHAGSERP
jgi:hypothetical protein